jgi:hypothetical protein
MDNLFEIVLAALGWVSRKLGGRSRRAGRRSARSRTEKLTNDYFSTAFELVAQEIGVPAQFREGFCDALRSREDNPRAAAKIAEDWLSCFPFAWPEGERFLREYEGKKATAKQLAALVATYVTGKCRTLEQWERIARTEGTHPYLLLAPGPVRKPCPIHEGLYDLVLPVEHSFWIERPLRETVFCRCSVRQLSQHEMDRLRREGIQDPHGPPIRDTEGTLTGHRARRTIQIRETWP